MAIVIVTKLHSYLCLNRRLVLLKRCGLSRTVPFAIAHESGRVISRFGNRNCPPRPYDLTATDFFCEFFLESHITANKPTITHTLKAEIEHWINKISRHSCNTGIENYSRIVPCTTKAVAVIYFYSIHNS